MTKKERVVYVSEDHREIEESADVVAQQMRQAENAKDAEAFREILIRLKQDPTSESFKKRMAAFRRAHGLD